MLKTFQTQYKQGKIILTSELKIPENSVIFVSYVDNSKDDFFLNAQESSLENLWNNNEDDIYEQLLKK
jgi:hypothetical protein